MTNAERQRQYRQRKKAALEAKNPTRLQSWVEDHKRVMDKLRAWNLKMYRSFSGEREIEFRKIMDGLASTEAAFRSIAWSGVPWEHWPEWMKNR